MSYGRLLCLIPILLLAGCGGGDDSTAPPSGPNPVPPGIGAAGGTVAGPNGAQVVVPAGALAQNVVIAVTQDANGAPALPAGITAVGEIFAFTPHGTTFAVPARITVPFDASRLSGGAMPELYKTNGQNAWELVAGATVTGGTITGNVSGFSHVVAAWRMPIPTEPYRNWWFYGYRADDEQWPMKDGNSHSGEVFDTQVFGPLVIAPDGRDLDANGEVYSNATGRTFWVESEAPAGNISVPDSFVGAETRLYQMQFYRKSESDATLRFVITEAWIQAIDNNGTLPVMSLCPWAQNTSNIELCLDELFAELEFSVAVIQLEDVQPGDQMLQTAHQGSVRLWGWQGDWRWSFQTEGAYRFHYTSNGPQVEFVPIIPVFNEDQFDFEISAGAASGTDASIRLREPVVVEVDISSIPLDKAFFVETYVNAITHNRRGRESYIGARLRDPAQSTGLDWEIDGLEVIAPVEFSWPAAPDNDCAASGASEDAGTVQFSAESFHLAEFKHTSRAVLVTRTGGDEGKVIARVSTSDGSALAGTHYQPVSQIVTFQDGDTTPRLIRIPIINDNSYSGEHSFDLTLASVENCANLGDPATATVTILDDETPPPTALNVGGTITGLVGSGLLLRDVVTGEELAPEAGDTTFTFDYDHFPGFTYEVRIATQPTNPTQVCSIANPAGTLGSSHVTNIAVTCTTPASTGGLDPGFGQGGKVTGVLAGGGKKLALLPDGKVLLLGDRALRRFNADGSDDDTFGVAGIADVMFTGISNEAFGLAVQADGRILVAGVTRVGTQTDFALARFNADGTPDTTFGTNGNVYTDFAASNDRAYAVLVQPDGAIIVGGHAALPGGVSGVNNEFAVARFTTAGVLDASFDGDGRATVNIAGDTDLAYAAALAADGRIVLAGRVAAGGGDEPDVGVARFLANGAVDTTFGTDGVLRMDHAGGNSDEANDVLIQPDGKIVIAGFATQAGGVDFLVARFTEEGERDAAFGPNQGYATHSVAPGNDFAQALVREADGGLLLAGNAPSATVSDCALVRFTGDGFLDTTFEGDGVFTVDFFGAGDGAEDIAIQPDGRIVVSGSARNGGSVGLGLIRMAQ